MGMYVWNLEMMSDFYQEVLGFLVTDKGFVRDHHVVFLSRDPCSHHQLVMETGRPPGSGAGFGLQQISFQVDELENLRMMLRLVEDRADVSGIKAVDHGNSWSLYFLDPEENRVEIYLDTPWHISQPYLEPLDLSLDNDAICQITKDRVKEDPTMMPMLDWRKQMEGRLRN